MTDYAAYVKEQNYSWLDNGSSASQWISSLLWQPKIHYHASGSKLMGPILSQYNPVSIHIPFLWASVVSIATRFGLNVPRDRNPVGGGIFRTHPDRLWGPPSLLYNGYRVTFSGVKRPGHAIKQPPPPLPSPATRFDKEYSNTSIPPLGLHDLS